MIMKCPWSTNHPLLEKYHDNEWGTPIHDDVRHFEFFTMDLFQAGLSWLIILKKREGFREAFDGFDFRKIARYDEQRIQVVSDKDDVLQEEITKIVYESKAMIKSFKKRDVSLEDIFLKSVSKKDKDDNERGGGYNE